MFKKIMLCLLIMGCCFNADATFRTYTANALTGGGSGAADNIDAVDTRGDGTNITLSDGDSLIVVVPDDRVYFYTLDATSGAASNPPYVLQPRNSGSRRFILVDTFENGVLKTGAFSSLNAAHTAAVAAGANLIIVDKDIALSANLTPTIAIYARAEISGAYTLDLSSCPKFEGSPGCFDSTLTVSGLNWVNAKWCATSAQAVGAVTTGGIIYIEGDYDVATYGVFSLNKVCNIEGIGIKGNAADDLEGSVIINSGSDVVDSPVITFDGDGTRMDRPTIKNIGILHEGPSSFAVLFDDAAYSYMDNVLIDLNSAGYGGVKYDNASFFAKQNNTRIKSPTDYGTYVSGSGSEHIFIDCHMSASSAGAIAFYTEQAGTHIIRGQYSGTGADGNAIKFYNTGASDKSEGYISGVLFEGVPSGEYGIVIDGATDDFRGVIIDGIRGSLSDNDGTLVKFEHADHCQLIRPQIDAALGGGTLVEFGENSKGCELITQFRGGGQAPVTVHASATNITKTVTTQANRTDITVQGAANSSDVWTDSNMTTILTGGVAELTPGFIPVHNGTAWNFWLVVIADDAASSYTPPTAFGIAKVMSNNDIDHFGIVGYDVGASSEVQEFAIGDDFETTTGALTGTDGTDAKVTFSAHTDGKVYIENRRGGNTYFTVLFDAVVYGL